MNSDAGCMLVVLGLVFFMLFLVLAIYSGIAYGIWVLVLSM